MINIVPFIDADYCDSVTISNKKTKKNMQLVLQDCGDLLGMPMKNEITARLIIILFQGKLVRIAGNKTRSTICAPDKTRSTICAPDKTRSTICAPDKTRSA